MKSPPAARRRSHSARGRRANTSSRSAMHSPAFIMRSRMVLKRGSAARVHDPGAREPEVVEGWRAALRPLGPVAAGARVDEARVLGAEGGRVEPEPRRHALAEVLYEHVGALGEALHDRHARGLLQ